MAAAACRRCGRAVYANEAHEIKPAGEPYHRACFACACGTRLSAVTVKTHGADIFCSGCYAKAQAG